MHFRSVHDPSEGRRLPDPVEGGSCARRRGECAARRRANL